MKLAYLIRQMKGTQTVPKNWLCGLLAIHIISVATLFMKPETLASVTICLLARLARLLLNNRHLSGDWVFHFIPIPYPQQFYFYLCASGNAVTSQGISAHPVPPSPPTPHFPCPKSPSPFTVHWNLSRNGYNHGRLCFLKKLHAFSKVTLSLCLPQLITVGGKQYFYTSNHNEMSLSIFQLSKKKKKHTKKTIPHC